MEKRLLDSYVKQIPTAEVIDDFEGGKYIKWNVARDVLKRSVETEYGIPYLGAEEPKMATLGSAGYDLCARYDTVVPPHGRLLVGTGLRMALPLGLCAIIHGRSGLAAKHGIVAFNGVIDSDYRGEVKVLLFNHSDEPFEVKAGYRIAQMVLIGYASLPFILSEELGGTERGTGGFGSTGE